MAKDWKQLLADAAKKKRSEVRLLKDVSPDDLLVACDYCEAERLLDPTIFNNDWVRYLKYANAAQLAALTGRIPFVTIAFRRPGPNPAPLHKVCFKADFVSAVLKFLGVDNYGKYLGNPVKMDFLWKKAIVD